MFHVYLCPCFGWVGCGRWWLKNGGNRIIFIGVLVDYVALIRHFRSEGIVVCVRALVGFGGNVVAIGDSGKLERRGNWQYVHALAGFGCGSRWHSNGGNMTIWKWNTCFSYIYLKKKKSSIFPTTKITYTNSHTPRYPYVLLQLPVRNIKISLIRYPSSTYHRISPTRPNLPSLNSNMSPASIEPILTPAFPGITVTPESGSLARDLHVWILLVYLREFHQTPI